MRLWTLHPKYLDPRGLVALWREALLAQAVLREQTCGYTRHPQLIRFRNSPSPLEAIASYLQAVHAEATRRGYCFDLTKIAASAGVEPIAVPRGQLDYEWEHLKGKLRLRIPSWLTNLEPSSRPEAHPLFHIIPGPVAEWEVVQPKKKVYGE
ncbi:MAG: pyrimidine dimer DNA glycosylase/endonuclease V [Syntrophales bacterium]